MIVDCDGCAARGHGCAECVVSVLLGPAQGAAHLHPDLDAEEERAVAALRAAGLVSSLVPLPVVSFERPEPARRRPAPARGAVPLRSPALRRAAG